MNKGPILRQGLFDLAAETVSLVLKTSTAEQPTERARKSGLASAGEDEKSARGYTMTPKRRDVGSGSLFLQKGCQRWFIQYYVDGRRVRERTGLASRRKAQDLLTERLAQVRKGEWTAPRKVPRIAELYTALEDYNKVHRPLRSLRDLRTRWGKRVDTKGNEVTNLETEGWRWKGHLSQAYAQMPTSSLTTEALTNYARKRKEEGAANGTVNRQFATLRRMFNLAYQSNRIPRVPHFPMLREDNARQGFVEDTDFARLTENATEPWLRTFLELAFTYGWRRGELIGLRVRQINLTGRSIRLDPGTTKNCEGREVAMTPKVFELLRMACQGKKPEDSVLTRGNCKPVRDFRQTWRNLCVSAGLGKWFCRGCNKEAVLRLEALHQCPQCKGTRLRSFRYDGRIVHDMRRSGAKALRAAGVPESVIMSIGGWKTAAMFRRYAIVSSADQRAAMEALERSRSLNAALMAAKECGADELAANRKPQ